MSGEVSGQTSLPPALGSSYLEKSVGAGAVEAVGSGIEGGDKGATF